MKIFGFFLHGNLQIDRRGYSDMSFNLSLVARATTFFILICVVVLVAFPSDYSGMWFVLGLSGLVVLLVVTFLKLLMSIFRKKTGGQEPRTRIRYQEPKTKLSSGGFTGISLTFRFSQPQFSK